MKEFDLRTHSLSPANREVVFTTLTSLLLCPDYRLDIRLSPIYLGGGGGIDWGILSHALLKLG